jgi:uncharacterized protein involved in exopolysaccharide biosynthesis
METDATARDDDEGGGIDFDHVKQIAGFFVRAPRRRPKIAVITLVVGLAVVTFLAAFLPRTYTVDVRFLAQRNLMLPALGNPGRNIPQEAGNLTRGVADSITRRDNMVELAKDVDLLSRWKATRPGILRLKDSMSAMVFGAPSDEERLRGLIAVLERRLTVLADDSSVTISLDWPDKQLAFDLVSALGRNFVEARYDSEVAVINEAIEILDQKAKEQGTEVDAALADLVKLDADRRALGVAPPPVQVTPPVDPSGSAAALPSLAAVARLRATPPPAPTPTIDTSDDVARLAEVRRRLSEIDTEQKRKVSDAERQLDDARVTLGPMHPTVVALGEKIEELKQPSSETAALKAEERRILERLSSYGETDSTPASTGAAPPRVLSGGGGLVGGGSAAVPRPSMRAAAPLLAIPSPQDDPRMGAAREKLATATTRYDELLRRIEAAQIELDVARASFKYQYIVVRPPELPASARQPNIPRLVLVGILATILLALGLAGAADLLSGRIVEPWQVEQRLKLTILGELPVAGLRREQPD